jgi:hypothetical protein
MGEELTIASLMKKRFELSNSLIAASYPLRLRRTYLTGLGCSSGEISFI